MDCNLAELYMMHHFEKTISPEDAQALAQHLMVCEACRESYVMFDENMECFTEQVDFVMAEPPADFTENVMTKVRGMAAYSKVIIKSESPAGGQIILRVLWGFSAVLIGALVFFFFNPDMFAAFAETFPVAYSIQNAFIEFGTFLSGSLASVAQSAAPVASDNLSVTAILFVAVMGTLLFILHNGEKSAQT